MLALVPPRSPAPIGSVQKWLTVTEAAKALGLTRTRTAMLIEDGPLAAAWFDGSLCIHSTAIDAFLGEP